MLYVMAGVALEVPLEERTRTLRPLANDLRTAAMGLRYAPEYREDELRAKLVELEKTRAKIVAAEFLTSQSFKLEDWINGTYHKAGGVLDVRRF